MQGVETTVVLYHACCAAYRCCGGGENVQARKILVGETCVGAKVGVASGIGTWSGPRLTTAVPTGPHGRSLSSRFRQVGSHDAQSLSQKSISNTTKSQWVSNIRANFTTRSPRHCPIHPPPLTPADLPFPSHLPALSSPPLRSRPIQALSHSRWSLDGRPRPRPLADRGALLGLARLDGEGVDRGGRGAGGDARRWRAEAGGVDRGAGVWGRARGIRERVCLGSGG